MKIRLEKDIEKKVRQYTEDEGGIWIKLLADGRKGIPDNLLLLPPVKIGRYDFPVHAMVELKRPRGSSLSLHQERWLNNLSLNRQPCHVGYSIDHVREIIEYERQSIRRRVMGARAEL